MKSKLNSCILFVLATVVSVSASTVSAQEAKSPGIVAVLDVARVFKENREFESAMQRIKGTADQLKANIQQKQEVIKQEAQGLQTFEVGSPDRNNLEASLEQKQTALRTEARQAEQDLLTQEAKVYFDTYQKMQGILAKMAVEYNISLVLRFDSEKVDPTKRADVIKGVNRAVVYQRELDLTNLVIQKMTETTANAGAPNYK